MMTPCIILPGTMISFIWILVRPTILLVPKDDESTLITPLLDVLLVPEDAPVEKIETWNDGVGDEWREFLPKIINKKKNIACEKYKINAPVSIYLSELTNGKLIGRYHSNNK
jgi:hypothetical protein